MRNWSAVPHRPVTGISRATTRGSRQKQSGGVRLPRVQKTAPSPRLPVGHELPKQRRITAQTFHVKRPMAIDRIQGVIHKFCIDAEGSG